MQLPYRRQWPRRAQSQPKASKCCTKQKEFCMHYPPSRPQNKFGCWRPAYAPRPKCTTSWCRKICRRSGSLHLQTCISSSMCQLLLVCCNFSHFLYAIHSVATSNGAFCNTSRHRDKGYAEKEMALAQELLKRSQGMPPDVVSENSPVANRQELTLMQQQMSATCQVSGCAFMG